MVTGQEKAAIMAEIIQNPGKNRYPASLVNPLKGTLTWLLNADAAKVLHDGVK